MYVENEYCAKHRRVPVNKLESLPSSNLILSAMAWGSCHSWFDPYDLSSDDDKNLTPDNVAETMPGQSYYAARLLTAARIYLSPLPEAPKNWGQINPNCNDYHSDPMEIRSTFLLPDITEWLRQQEETHSKYADLSNVARDIFSIIRRGVEVEASFSIGRDVIGWRQSETTGETLLERVIVREFARANDRIFAGADPSLDTTNTENDMEWTKRERKGNCTEWPRLMTFSRCGCAAETYLLPRRNLPLKTSRWPPLDTFRTRKGSSQHPGHSSNIMVWLHSNCQKDLLCHHFCLQRTSLENKLKYWMMTESEKSTVMQSKVMRIALLKAFWTLKISLTGMGT